MSELLQSGQHPDADQLNAFVEHTLAPHEQEQTLAHLAICPDCRSIVSLSLPVEAAPGLKPESVRKPWFSGWNLAWPVAAALSGLTLFIVHIHNVATTRSSATAPTQMAVSHPPAPLPSPAIATSPGQQTPSSLSSELRSRSSHPTAAKDAHSSNPQKTQTVVNGRNVPALSAQSRNFAELKQLQPGSPIGAGDTPPHTSIRGSSAGLSMGSGAALPQAPSGNPLGRLQQNASGAAPVNLGSQSVPVTPTAAPTMTFAQAAETAPAPPPPAVAAAPVSAADQTVAFTAGAPVATLSSISNRPALNQTKSILAQHPLPSQLPALSAVSTAHQTLAIDTQNTLFFSDDDGKHWKAIRSQWGGRAVKVDLTPSGVLSGRSSTIETNNIHPPSNIGAFGGPIYSQPPIANSVLTGTVTDSTGAVIPDVSVVVGDTITPNVRTVKTDRAGRYLVDDLLPGNYQVEAQAPGFAAQQLAVTLAASQQNMANLTLSVGQSAEAVTVDASPMPLETLSLAKKKTPEPPPAVIQPLPLFEITTDTGDRWTSIDGQTWKRK
jgi:hypothetical protein